MDDGMMAPEQIEQKFIPALETDLEKLESHAENELKNGTNCSEQTANPPISTQVETSPCEKPNQQPNHKPSEKTNENSGEKPIEYQNGKSLEDPSDKPIKVLCEKQNNTKKRGRKPKKVIAASEASGEAELCEQCGLSFTNPNEYKKHVRSHNKNKGNVLFTTFFQIHY